MKILLIIIFIFIFSNTAYSRPEYAVRENVNCSQCHISPWGGGARRSFGKIYGARDLKQSKHLESDWYYLDFRAIFASSKLPSGKKSTNNMQGNGSGHGNKKKGLMTAQASLKYEFLEDYTTTINYDLGRFRSKLRETYFLIEKENYSLLIGQFFLPFGLLTDEHRTYTKMITATGLRDYEKGVVLNKKFNDRLYLNIGLLKGYNSLNQGQSDYGLILNTRYFHKNSPLLTGLSYVQHKGQKIEPKAFSIYGTYYLKKLFNATLSFEYVIAKGFNSLESNSRYMPRIIPSNLLSNYALEIEKKIANAAQVELRYELKKQILLIYKLDYLVLDQSKRKESFIRNGFGIRYQPFHNILILAKYEFSNITLPNYIKSDVYTVTESQGPLLMLRAWY